VPGRVNLKRDRMEPSVIPGEGRGKERPEGGTLSNTSGNRCEGEVTKDEGGRSEDTMFEYSKGESHQMGVKKGGKKSFKQVWLPGVLTSK